MGDNHLDARLAMAAFPHWARSVIHSSDPLDERKIQLAEMADEAKDLGWDISPIGEAVAPEGWVPIGGMERGA